MSTRSPSRPVPGLFDVSGTARYLHASPLFAIGPAEPRPAIRRGFLLAVPIGVCLAIELAFDAPTKGAVASGSLLTAFVAMDAPALPRAAWQAVAAPTIGLAAALGILTSQSAPVAVLAMAVVAGASGHLFAYSLRLAIFGLMATLGLLVGQGLFLPAADAAPALLWGTVGGLTQVAWSLLAWAVLERCRRGQPSGWDGRAVLAALRSNLDLSSDALRHGIRFGVAMAAGVAAYRIFDMEDHGFWIPLTILFVMRPGRDETYVRVVLRAIGTAAGLVIATAAAETVGGSDAAVIAILFVATALSLGLLSVHYAMFTAAITTYIVLLTDTLGSDAWQAADLRAIGTAAGLAITVLAWMLWPGRGQGHRLELRALRPAPDPPDVPSR